MEKHSTHIKLCSKTNVGDMGTSCLPGFSGAHHVAKAASCIIAGWRTVERSWGPWRRVSPAVAAPRICRHSATFKREAGAGGDQFIILSDQVGSQKAAQINEDK